MSFFKKAPAAQIQNKDNTAIADLRAAFEAQRKAFAADRNPSLAERRQRLEKLIGMMAMNRERISQALAKDFGAHPTPASDLIEVLGVIGRAQYVLEHLEQWMQPAPREADAAMLGTGRAYIQYQPKGVIGNIVPWNFPFDLSVGPLTEMLAAGNRVIIKPSEFAPASGALLREMVEATFDPSLVYVALGEKDLAVAFSATPWDHLLYTGSPNVGRLVMAAAAKNLTPVTLELGGKCPAIITPGAVSPKNVEQIVGVKSVKNGQMCVSVDYVFVPRQDVELFVDQAKTFLEAAAPNYARGPECTGIISERHLQRLLDMVREAKDRGARVIALEADESVHSATRGMPMFLAIDPPRDTRLMQEEIFGPILPILPYDNVQEAIDVINAGERPLGLYVFGDDESMTNHILDATTSGGATVNACAVQAALPSLAFGGSGTSGMGRHHGFEGFREFSNQRGVVVRGEGDLISAFYAPHSKAAALVSAALSGS